MQNDTKNHEKQSNEQYKIEVGKYCQMADNQKDDADKNQRHSPQFLYTFHKCRHLNHSRAWWVCSPFRGCWWFQSAGRLSGACATWWYRRPSNERWSSYHQSRWSSGNSTLWMKSTRRGSFSVHRSEKTPGPKYSSTSGLSPRGPLERQAEFPCDCSLEFWRWQRKCSSQKKLTHKTFNLERQVVSIAQNRA